MSNEKGHMMPFFAFWSHILQVCIVMKVQELDNHISNGKEWTEV